MTELNAATTAEEIILIDRARDGDIAAYEDLISRYQQKLFNIACYFCGNTSLAEDICQEVFIKVFKSIGQYKGKSSFSTWLYQIAKNTFLNEKKKIQRKRENQESESGIEEPATTASFTDDLEKKELQSAVGQAIEKLSPKLKLILVLCDIQGLSYEEAAQAAGTSAGTVASRLSRARQELKEILPSNIQEMM